MTMKRRLCIKILAVFLAVVMVVTNITWNAGIVSAEENSGAGSTVDSDADATEAAPVKYHISVIESAKGCFEYRVADSEDAYAIIPEEGLDGGTYDFRYTGATGYLVDISGFVDGVCENYSENTTQWYQIWTFSGVVLSGDIEVDITETKCSVVTVNGGEGSFSYKPEGETDYQEVSGSVVALRPGMYTFQYVAAGQRALHISGEEGIIRYVTKGENWQQQWEASVELEEGDSCTLTVAEAEILIESEDVIVPEFSYPLSVKADTDEEWGATAAQGFTFSSDTEGVVCMEQDGRWLLKYKKENEELLETITVTASNGSVTLKKEFSVAADSGVSYGTDFSVENTEGMYAEVTDEGLTLYHNGTIKAINVFKNRYTDYRYRFDDEKYPETFSSFDEGENRHSIALTGTKMYLQMKNTDSSSPMFGSSGAVQIVEDTQAPVIDIDTVKVKQGFSVSSPYGTVYAPEAFHAPTLDFKVTEDHLLKIEVELGTSGNIITLQPNTPNGNVYTYEDIPLGEADAFSNGSIKITVYDKAMNTDVYIYPADSSKKITYVKNATTLGVPTVTNKLIVKSGKTFVVANQGKMNMSVHISSELLIPELLELRLLKVNADGSRTEKASFRSEGQDIFTVSGGNGEWDVSCSYTFSSADDGGYVIEVYYTDIAKNQVISCKNATIFYIDMSPVTLSVASEQVSSGGITNCGVRLTYTMKENNPDFEQICYEYSSAINSTGSHITDVTLIKPDGTTEAVPISELAARVNDSSVWKQNQDVYTLTLLYAKESVYNTKLTVGDTMGNQASAKYNFRVDLTAPQISAVDVETDYEDNNKTDYNRFDKTSATVTVKVLEEIAQASEMEIVCITKDETTGAENNVILSSPQQEGNTFIYSLTIKKNFKGTISFTTKDVVNSSDVLKAELINGIIVEGADKHKESSSYAITENGTANANGFYRRDVSLKFSAQETYSGIKSIEYSINGTKTTVDFSKAQTIRTLWEKTPVYIKAVKANEGNDIQVSLTITDNAGHKDTISKSFKVDITKPSISVSYDNNNAANETYYKESRTATISIRELNYDSRNTTVTVYQNGVPSTVKNTFRTDGKLVMGEDGTTYKEYIMRLPFDEDGDYTFKVETTDLAGNKAVYEESSRFTIDKTMPEMEISYNNNSPYKEQYYGAERTATITVTEHNFDAAGIEVNITASREGTELTTPSVSAFTTVGDVHTAKVTFLEDGDYTISATCMDLAGNVGNSIPEQQFTVDLTAPEIEITGISENVSYNKKVLPVVTVTDGNYDTEGVQIEIIGGRNGLVQDMNPTVSETNDGERYSYPDFQYMDAYDDCYVIKVTAIDKAGHQSEASVNYRVNRFGSIYTPNSALQQMVDQYYGCASDEYAIIVTNVDRLIEYQVFYTLDNEIVNLTEGVDYEVNSLQTKNMWMQYEYKLKASVFEREGVYSISVSSIDAAGNITDNKSKHTVLEFCIDNTAPSCIISGVSEAQRFEQEDEISIGLEVYDNIKLATVSVLLNGSEQYTEKDFVDGRITDIPIDRNIKDQVITVVCRDAAGNERIETVHFSCHVDALELNALAWIFIILAGLGIVLGFVLFAKRQRRRKEP